MYHAIICAVNHPDSLNPQNGVYNSRSVAALDTAGVELDVVVPRPFAPPFGPYSNYSDLPPIEQWNSYLIHHPRFFYAIPKQLFYGLTGESYAKRVSRYMTKNFQTPEIYHGGHLYPDGYGLVKHAKNEPVTATAHGTLINSFGSFSKSVQSKIRQTIRQVEMVTCVSESLEQSILELEPGAKTTVVPLGSDPGKFPTNNGRRIRSELDINSDSKVVLFVGHFNDNKGVPDLLSAIRDIDTNEPVTYIFVGHGGEYRWKVVSELSNLSGSREARVYWNLDPLALRRLFAIANLLVLPSYSEGRPTVIYEAMASETPVLATDVGGIPEQVKNGETGWIIEPGAKRELTNKLNELLRLNITDLDRIGERGKNRLERKQWTWNDFGQKMTSIHKELLE